MTNIFKESQMFAKIIISVYPHDCLHIRLISIVFSLLISRSAGLKRVAWPPPPETCFGGEPVECYQQQQQQQVQPQYQPISQQQQQQSQQTQQVIMHSPSLSPNVFMYACRYARHKFLLHINCPSMHTTTMASTTYGSL
jgi:hypothetical protein